VLKQVSLQFTSKHWQRWSRCDVFGRLFQTQGQQKQMGGLQQWPAVMGECQVGWKMLTSTGSATACRRLDAVDWQVSRSCALQVVLQPYEVKFTHLFTPQLWHTVCLSIMWPWSYDLKSTQSHTHYSQLSCELTRA